MEAQDTNQRSDHDLLVRLDEQLGNVRGQINEVRVDIKDLKDGTTTKIEDHEARLKKLETKTSNYFITITLYSIAVGGMIGLIIYHILQKD